MQGLGLLKVLFIVIITLILDIISDLLRMPSNCYMNLFGSSISNLSNTVISIPLILLWKVKIKPQQKIFIGIFLCLSICMIIIAIVRGSVFRRNNVNDPVWILFWHQIEGAVAIITVSITAFRSLLGIKALKALERKKLERYWFSQHQKLRAKLFQKSTQGEPKSGQLPSIPGATLTGIRTFINGQRDPGQSKTDGNDP